MKRKELIESTIPTFNQAFFDRIKHTLIDNYITVNFIEEDEVNCNILQEILYDYFEKVELQQSIKSFDSVIDKYASDINSVIDERIEKSRKDGNGKELVRARRYYNKALEIKKGGLPTFEEMVDYTRIMLCLYMAIINNKYKPISDFDYSSECLKGKIIMDSLRNEESSSLIGKKKRFDIKGIYSFDRCSFVVLIIMYCYIKNTEQEAER